ncbi:lipase family protein [Sphingomonas sp. G-3-2-10]|uniref:lipase family protein n=1 Tax=Sphingomonas sp. G-3-2-10 TaxID=2728838 RepID=UPI00146F73B7|nr:lipase family protein [Sphingomonas sp. G-3-2-10]NML06709.1 lipase family protein [Sphingomonas sp. G-3-2-10]
MHDCMKRRLLYAASQTYQPRMEVEQRRVGWIEPPMVIGRQTPVTHREIDLALVGRVKEGVVVAFRGSLPPYIGSSSAEDGWAVVLDWLNDGLSVCVQDPAYPGGVHLGFADSIRRLWEDADGAPGVGSAIRMQLERGAREHLFLTGHSKGGALANLAAYRAATTGAWGAIPVSALTIAAARAGNGSFARAYAATRIACLRYEMPSDLVPHLPPGPETPAWVNGIVGALVPGLAAQDYHPVGMKVTERPGMAAKHKRWAGSRRKSMLAGLLGRRGIGLGVLAPGVVTAHAICPDSGYDQLICTGEGDCHHGKRRAAG